VWDLNQLQLACHILDLIVPSFLSAGGVLLDLTYISQDRAIPPQAGRIRLATYDAQAGGRVMYTTRAQRPFYFQRRGSGLAPLRLLLEAGPDDLKESA